MFIPKADIELKVNRYYHIVRRGSLKQEYSPNYFHTLKYEENNWNAMSIRIIWNTGTEELLPVCPQPANLNIVECTESEFLLSTIK